MSIITDISLGKDEDYPAIIKKKSRNPKPRDKWSLLWFIPSQVLNLREEGLDGKGRTVKKGKRFGFDTYNRLSCKVCRKSFHKYEGLAFHTIDSDHGRLNPSNNRSLPQSCNSVSNRSFSTKKSALEIQRKPPVEPFRKSSRLSIKPVTYDDEIEILEVEETSKISVKKMTNENYEKRFTKLTLSAKRKIVEEYNSENKKSSNKSTKIHENKTAKSTIKSMPRKSRQLVDSDSDIEIIDIDIDENPKSRNPTMESMATVEITKLKDDELLLAEDDAITNEDENKKRKSMNNIQTPAHKKLKHPTTKSDEMVEVKSSSGKSMFVKKATLEKIMATKSLKKVEVSKNTDDEKLLTENDQVVKSVQTRHQMLSGDSETFIVSSKKTRSRGI